MKATSLLVAAGALAGAVSVQFASVVNNCDFDVYFQTYPYSGNDIGPLTKVLHGEIAVEPFRPGGATIKLARTRTLTDPLFFGYSFNPSVDRSYYEFSTQWGNPFSNFHNSLSPGSGCDAFDCAAETAACYSTPAAQKIYECNLNTNLTATLCQS